MDTKPNVVTAWLLLGEIAERLGKNTDAITAWQRVSDYAPPLEVDYQRSVQHLAERVGLRWQVKPDRTIGNLITTKGMLYVKGWDGVYVLESETGKLVNQYPNAALLPYLKGGPVYLYFEGLLHALEAQTARVLWTYDIHSLRSEYYAYVLDEAIFIEDSVEEKLYVLSAKSGELLWISKTRGWFVAGFDASLYTHE